MLSFIEMSKSSWFNLFLKVWIVVAVVLMGIIAYLKFGKGLNINAPGLSGTDSPNAPGLSGSDSPVTTQPPNNKNVCVNSGCLPNSVTLESTVLVPTGLEKDIVLVLNKDLGVKTRRIGDSTFFYKGSKAISPAAAYAIIKLVSRHMADAENKIVIQNNRNFHGMIVTVWKRGHVHAPSGTSPNSHKIASPAYPNFVDEDVAIFMVPEPDTCAKC